MLSSVVLMATFNGQRYLGQAIASILAQQRLPGRLVVVDDGSTDGTVALLREAQRDSQLRIDLICRESNSGGPVIPLNQAMAAATEDVVFLLDQDDTMDPKRIARQAAFLEAQGEASAVVGMLALIGPDGEEIPNARPTVRDRLARISSTDLGNGMFMWDQGSAYDSMLLHGSLVIASNVGFRRRAWSPLDEGLRIAWDLEFALKLLQAGRIGFLDVSVGSYRIHAENLSKDLARTSLEYAKICARHLRAPAFPIHRSQLRESLQRSFADLGYQFSRKGNVCEAMQCYREARAHGAALSACARGMIKIVPHFLRSLVSRGGPVR